MPASTRTAKQPARHGHRGFRLEVEPADEGAFGLRLHETNGRPDHARPVAHLPAARYSRVSDAVVAALSASGKQPRVLAPTRKQPIDLDEMAGVRLALALNVVHGITKPGRTRALLDGVARLSDEECLYWYAACCAGTPVDQRRTKALRIYLAAE
jgi:hypothetical protein